MNKYPETVLAYIEKDDSYLMLYRNKEENDINKGKWIGVGGHLESGETPDMALIREIKEETGYNVKSYQKKGLIYFRYNGYTEIMHLYLVNEVSGELIECDEGTLQYVPKKDIYNLNMWEGDKIFLKYLLSNEPYFELELNYNGDKLISYRFL